LIASFSSSDSFSHSAFLAALASSLLATFSAFLAFARAAFWAFLAAFSTYLNSFLD